MAYQSKYFQNKLNGAAETDSYKSSYFRSGKQYSEDAQADRIKRKPVAATLPTVTTLPNPGRVSSDSEKLAVLRANMPTTGDEAAKMTRNFLSGAQGKQDETLKGYSDLLEKYRDRKLDGDQREEVTSAIRALEDFAQSAETSGESRVLARNLQQELKGLDLYSSYPMYTAAQFTAGFNDTARNIHAGAQTLLGDIRTGGGYSDAYKKLETYFAENPNTDMSNTLQIGLDTGLGQEVIRAYLDATAPERELAQIDRTYGQQLKEGYKNLAGGAAYSIGQMMPGMMITGLAPAGAASGGGGIIGSVMNRSGVGAAMKSALKGNPTTWLLGASSGAGKLNSLARQYGFDEKNYVNAAGTGFVEGFTEGLFGFSDAASFRKLFSGTTGNTLGSIAKAFGNYLFSGLEEGLEEVANVPMEGLLDKFTLEADKPWVGTGGVFDVEQMVAGGLQGAAVGLIMGGVANVANIGSILRESGDIRAAVKTYNQTVQTLPEELRPAMLDANAATAEDVREASNELVQVLADMAQGDGNQAVWGKQNAAYAAVEGDKNTASGEAVKVGQATVLKHPYSGKTPVQGQKQSPNVNNYKTHRLINIELTQQSGEVTGTPPASAESASALTDPIIRQAAQGVNNQSIQKEQGVFLPESALEENAGTVMAEETRERLAKATTDTQRSGIMMGADDGAIAQAERLSEATGRKVMFYKLPAAEGGIQNGYYDNLEGVIWVNTESRQTVPWIIAHELTHSAELTEAYRELSALVLSRISQTGGNLQQMRQTKRDLYAENNVQLGSEAEIDAEIVADYVAEHLLTDEQSITELAVENPGLVRSILNWLNDKLAKWGNLKAREREFLRRARDAYARALQQSNTGFNMSQDAVAHQMQDAYSNGEMTEQEFDEALDLVMQEESLAGRSMLQEGKSGTKHSISERFAAEVDAWLEQTDHQERVVSPGHFRVGTTSEPLKSIGVRDGNVYWRKSKIGYIMMEHPEIGTETIKAVPAILERPIIVMKSQMRDDSIVLFGDVRAENGNPVMAALELTPRPGGGMEAEFSLITSAYSRSNENIKNLIQNSELLYIDENKNRADTWLMQLGVQFPSRQPVYGPVGSIAYADGGVKIQGKTLAELGRAMQAQGKPAEQQFSIGELPGAETQPASGQTVEELPAVEQQTEVEMLPDPAGALKGKTREFLQKAERSLVNRIGAKLNIPRQARRGFLNETVREISNEYLRTGAVSQETLDNLFEQAYDQGVIADTEFYEQYKDIKNYLRTTKVNITESIRGDIADFGNFRKRAFGVLNMVRESGIGVDVAYQELNGMAPELFPDSIINPSDQLQKMYEVGSSIRITEKTLEEYYGADAETYKQWYKHDFEVAVGDALAELRLVKRAADEQTAQKTGMNTVTLEQVKETYPKLKDARRKYERAMAKNLLTEADQRQVGRLMRGDIELSDLKENVRGITEVYQAKQEYEQLARVIRKWNRARKAELHERADSYLATANAWEDKAAGILYSRETMERNIRDIVPDKATADAVIAEYFAPVHTAQAEATRTKNSYRNRVKALGLSRKVAEGNDVSEAHAVQLLGEAEDNIRMLQQGKGRMKVRDGKTALEWQGVINALWHNNPNLDQGKIRGAVEEFRKIYDELFTQMNEARVRNGYEPINYRSGYFPHFQPGDGDGILVQFGKALGIDTAVSALPTTINGLTHTFKPGIQWFGNAQERLGFNTAYDAVEGFDKYIEGCADVIHQTDNIQNLRALAAQMRYRTGDDGIRKQIDDIRARSDLSDAEKDTLIQELNDKGKYTLGNFVVELDDYINLLANKKSRADRNMEQALGRNSYNLVKALESRVAANMVAVNPASWLTNFIPLTQGNAMLDRGMLLKGMWDTLKAYKVDDGIVAKSTFLTNRRGSDPLVKTWAQEWSGKAAKPMEYIDCFTADTLVRARYQQNLKRGLSEDTAMEEADAWVAGVMADRSKGSTPTLFNRSNPVTKVFTQFQLEVNNQLSYVFKDVPREAAGKGAAALAAALLKFALGAFLYDEIYEYFIGRRPALDPIGILNDTVGDLTGYELPNLMEAGADLLQGEAPTFRTERKGAYEALSNTAADLAEELPFIGGLLGGGRVPISSALPDVANLARAATDSSWSAKKRGAAAIKELTNPLTYLALPFGGGQVKKAVQGIQAVAEGGSYSVDAEGNDLLQYPVYTDSLGDAIGSVAGSMLFGKSSLPTGREWVESGFQTLSANETVAYKNMQEAGVSDRDAYELIQALRGAAKTEDMSEAAHERQVLRESDVSGEGKSVLYYDVMANDKEKAVMDTMIEMGADMGQILDVLMDIRDTEKQVGKLEAISAGDVSEEEGEHLLGLVMGTDLKTDEGNQTAYAKMLDALGTDLSLPEVIELKNSGANMDRFLDYTGAGIDAGAAMELSLQAVELREAEDIEGTFTIAENARMIESSGLSKEQQEIAWLVTYPNWAEKAAEKGVSTSDYIAYKKATYGLKKKADKLQALREAGFSVAEAATLYNRIN